MLSIGSFLSLAEKVLQLIELLTVEIRNKHIDLDIQVTLLVRIVNRHALFFYDFHETWLSDAGFLD